MKVLDNMKVSKKLTAGFLAVAGILVLLAGMAYRSLGSLNANTRGLYENNLVPIHELGDTKADLYSIRGDLFKLLLLPEERAKTEALIHDKITAVDLEADNYSKTKLTDDEAKGMAVFGRDWGAYKAEVAAILAAADSGKGAAMLARLRDGGSTANARKAVGASIDNLTDINARAAEMADKESAAVFARANLLNLITAAVAVAVAILLGGLLSASIAKPVAASADMIVAMSKGELDRRLKLDRDDEIGSMARALDTLADDLGRQAAAADAIASGDLGVNVQVRSDKDAMAKSLVRVVEVLHGLQRELLRLTEASKNGELSDRGKPDQFKGAYAEIVAGVNQMLDAILLPIGEGNRILAQISSGKIDELIAQTYKGDHEKMKVAVNNVGTTVQALQAELLRLTEASKNGELSERGKAAQFKGAYAEIVAGVNQMLDAILLPIGEGNRILDQIAAGRIDELIAQTYKGDHEKMKVAVNGVATTLQGLQRELQRLTEASKDGMLSERGKAAQFKGAYAELVMGINQMLDAILLPIGEGNRILAQISEGKVDELIAQTYKGDHEKMKVAVNGVALALQALVADSVMLSKAAVEGRLDTRADADKHLGDYRRVVQGVNETLDAVLGPINEAAQVLDRMAAKDLTARVKGDYKGGHAKIKDAINTAAENLDTSMQQVAVGAEQVASATAQIGAGSQSLAQGSSEQASSIEEVSSSLQEMGSMSRQSAGNAKEAKAVAEQAKAAADKGVNSMNLMSEAINKIKDSSDATAKIVKTIDEIAFQTNLLALNAAVEAARAGEAGKGFAVVAEEVRNLAMRSAEAAKNTANLIEGAVKNAENGVSLNEQVLVNFKEINERANKVAEVIAEIAAASEQQDVGITQVNKAVEQMSQVTQQNAANAEESSSAAEELSSQSEEMRSMVAGFTITGGAELAVGARKSGRPAPSHTVHQAPSNIVHLNARDPKAVLPLDEKDHRLLKGF